MINYIAVAVGGALGAIARYWIAGIIAARFDSRFPFSTLAINLSGSFVAGLFLTLASERISIHPTWRLAVAVGFLAAYTTFSTWAYESFKLLEEGSIARSLTNLIGGMILGILALWLGVITARGVDALIVALHGPLPHSRIDESFSEIQAIAGLPTDKSDSRD